MPRYDSAEMCTFSHYRGGGGPHITERNTHDRSEKGRIRPQMLSSSVGEGGGVRPYPWVSCSVLPRGSVKLRDTETGDPARLPAQIAGRWGLIMWEKCSVGKMIFCTGLIKAARCRTKISVNGTNHQKKDPYHYSFVLFESPFTSVHQSAGATPLKILWLNSSWAGILRNTAIILGFPGIFCSWSGKKPS